MGLLDAFTPEKLIKALGIDPAQLVQFMQSVTAEVAGFKQGFQSVIAHFNGKLSAQEARLSRIEEQQQRILALLEPVNPRQLANGHDTTTETNQ